MRARRFAMRRSGLATLSGCAVILLSGALAVGQPPADDPPTAVAKIAASDTHLAASFRSAVALQNRGLFDLAAAEWAAILRAQPHEPLAGQARFHHGICLFQLKQYAAAAAEFERYLTHHPAKDDALIERAQANLGLARYNQACESADAARGESFDAAVDAFNTQLDRFSDGPLAPQAVYYRAEAWYARGDLPAAIRGYQDLIKRFPVHPLRAEALYATGVAQQEQGKSTDAADTLEQFIDEYPQHLRAADARLRLEVLVPPALLAQAQAEERDHQLAAALRTLNELLSTYPHHELATSARLLRAATRLEMQRYTEALGDVKAVLAVRPPQSMRSDALLVRGICHTELGQLADAIQTFNHILSENAAYRSADRVLYELAWAYEKCGEPVQSTTEFRRLATEHPNSQFAGECWLRVGESAYAAKDFSAAAKCFQSAERLATDAELKEHAAHKLAWARFSLGQFAEAEHSFTKQVAQFPTGPFAADARIMIGETRFARQDYAAAFEAYAVAFTLNGGSPEVRSLGMLHAAQAAGQLDRWAESVALLNRCEKEFPDIPWRAEIRCERGWAFYHQQKWNAAWKEFEPIAAHHNDVLGARARFMLGEIQFARKQYDDAVRTFFKVAYGFGDREAASDFHRWQAEAMFEAARCLEETKRHDSARKLYRELLARFPDSAKAAHARVALGDSITR